MRTVRIGISRLPSLNLLIDRRSFTFPISNIATIAPLLPGRLAIARTGQQRHPSPTMASSVDAKLLKQTKFPPEFNQKVDMKKVNVEVMKK